MISLLFNKVRIWEGSAYSRGGGLFAILAEGVGAYSGGGACLSVAAYSRKIRQMESKEIGQFTEFVRFGGTSFSK